ncbi:MAG TPA: hypothetical protein P5287_03035 [bacterium]|nr:hypothetical protein [bacterium]
MNEELEVLKIVASLLDGSRIPYMVSGSIAASYYTVPRMTRDIDVVVELKQADVPTFVALFKGDFYIDEGSVRSGVVERGMFNLIHNRCVIKIDFIVGSDTEFQHSAFARRQARVIDGSPVTFISAEDLVIAKMLWAKDSLSETQVSDVRNLIAGVRGLDMRYIEGWVVNLGLKKIYGVVGDERHF